MAISFNGTGIFKPSYTRQMSDMRAQLEELSRQVATGKKADNYAGLGQSRELSISLRTRLASITSFTANIDTVQVRTQTIMTSLNGISDVAQKVKGSLNPALSAPMDGKRSSAQIAAFGWLDSTLEMLNADVGGRYLFGGRDVATRPVAGMNEVMYGTGGQAGFLSVADERRAADLGADGLGRLVIGAQSVGQGLAPQAAGDLTNAGAGGAGFVADGDVLRISLGGTDVDLALGTGPGAFNTLDDLVNAINADPALDGVTAGVIGGQLSLKADAGQTFAVSGTGAAALGLASPGHDPATSIALAEDFAGSPFGFKLANAGTTIGGATVTGPAGTPAGVVVDLAGANPVAGDTVRIGLTLPDGTTSELALSAVDGTPTARGEFQIARAADGSVDIAATTANLSAALGSTLAYKADTALVAASATKASADFFDTAGGGMPTRVDGSPAGSAVALRSATAGDTLLWYRGENGGDDARATQAARVDTTISVGYGLRANETGLHEAVAAIAAFAAVTLNGTDNVAARYTELTTRARSSLGGESNLGPLEGVIVSMSAVDGQLSAAEGRHETSESMLTGMLEDIEGVDKTEVGLKLLAVQSQLEASYAITSRLSQLTLTNYL